MRKKLYGTLCFVFLVSFTAIQISCTPDDDAQGIAMVLDEVVLSGLEMSGGGMGGGGSGGGDGDCSVGGLTEADCRACHDDLQSYPSLENSNADKHHLLVGSDVILSTAPPDAVLGDHYECLSCHPLVWSPETQSYSTVLHRDCLICHPVETVTGSPRHGTNRHHQTGFSCNTCHGDGVGGGGMGGGMGGW